MHTRTISGYHLCWTPPPPCEMHFKYRTYLYTFPDSLARIYAHTCELSCKSGFILIYVEHQRVSSRQRFDPKYQNHQRSFHHQHRLRMHQPEKFSAYSNAAMSIVLIVCLVGLIYYCWRDSRKPEGFPPGK